MKALRRQAYEVIDIWFNQVDLSLKKMLLNSMLELQ